MHSMFAVIGQALSHRVTQITICPQLGEHTAIQLVHLCLYAHIYAHIYVQISALADVDNTPKALSALHANHAQYDVIVVASC